MPTCPPALVAAHLLSGSAVACPARSLQGDAQRRASTVWSLSPRGTSPRFSPTRGSSPRLIFCGGCGWCVYRLSSAGCRPVPRSGRHDLGCDGQSRTSVRVSPAFKSSGHVA